MTRNLPHPMVFAVGVVRLTLVALLAVLHPIHYSPVVSAQQGTEDDPYRTELLDWSIAVTGPNYTLVDVALEQYPHGRGERVYIASVESLGFVEIALFDDNDSPEDTIDLMLRDFASASQSLNVLETGIVGQMHFALARFQLHQGPSGYFYIEVAEDIDGNVDLAQSIYTLDAEFLIQLDIARSEISLNGLPFLNEPVIDLDAIVAADIQLVASTPEPVTTPQRGTHVFETNSAQLVVDDPTSFDFPFTNSVLEVMYLRSDHGFGLAGFIHQHATSADEILTSVFVDAPSGAEAPVELFLESDGAHAIGVYRIQTQGETRIMVLTVTAAGDDLWIVEAIAATESEFANELDAYHRSVTFNGKAFLGEIDSDFIEGILDTNQD